LASFAPGQRIFDGRGGIGAVMRDIASAISRRQGSAVHDQGPSYKFLGTFFR
jgi:hypothetical protein